MYSFNYLEKIDEKYKEKIYQERLQFEDIYNLIEKYINDFTDGINYIVLGGTMGINILLKRERTYDDFVYDLYTENAFLHSNNLINLLDEKFGSETKIFSLKSAIPNVKYQISLNSRTLVIFHKLNEKSRELVLPIKAQTFNKELDIIVLPPEVHLIDIYRTLSSPASIEEWENELQNEMKLFKYLNERIQTGIIGSSDNNLDIRKLIGEKIYNDFIKNNKSIVLLGEHALKLISDIKINTNIIQLISSDDIENDFLIISNIIRQLDPNIPIIKIVRDLDIMQDFRLKRTTIKIGEIGNQKEIMYIYNTAHYDLIPFNRYYDENNIIQIANPFVLLRFLLIELWIVRLIKQNGYIDETFATFRINELISKLLILRNMIKSNDHGINKNLFDNFKNNDQKLLKIFQSESNDYIGYYENENLYQKQIAKDAQKKYYDYYPRLYKLKNNNYRIIN